MALRDPDRTRQNLLEVAACLFHQKGYNGTSLSDILNKAEVSKGALYHHFSNKQELLYAVVDELFKNKLLERWGGVVNAEEPIEAIASIIDSLSLNATEDEMCSGCPVHNLLAELSSTDEGLRTRISAIFKEHQQIIQAGVELAIERGQAKPETDAKRVALFFMCSLNGMPQMVTSCQCRELFTELTAALADYIRSFKLP